MNSVFENDKDSIKDGELINEAYNQGVDSFVPSTLFQNLVNNFSLAKKLYGETFLREVTSYDIDYLSRNVKVPEFQKELKQAIEENINKLKDSGLITKEGDISVSGVDLASFVLYKEELDSLITKGIYSDPSTDNISSYGEKKDIREYKNGDSYKNINIRKSLKVALRRNHGNLDVGDLRVSEKQSKESLSIIYALDASSSMKGRKIGLCKRAGVALSFKAIQNKDKVGLIIFGSEIKEELAPSRNFISLLKKITKIKAIGETNISNTIKSSIALFGNEKNKHLILLTDALPTKGKKPEKDSLEAASLARANKITISLVGLGLDKKGEGLAKDIVAIGEGRLYNIQEIDTVDKIILNEYYALKK